MKKLIPGWGPLPGRALTCGDPATQLGDEEGSLFYRDRVSLALSVVTPTAEPQTLSPRTAVDEQNAQTQEQERLVLGLSESEGKKDLKSDDRLCHSGSCGAAKCRSLRKGTVRLARGPQRRHQALSPLRLPREVSGCFFVIALVTWQCGSQDT